MSFATRMQDVALKLLTKYGQSISVERIVEGAFVPSTGAVGSGSTTTYTGVGHPSPYEAREIDNNLILTGDIQLLLKSTTLPLVGDVVTIDSTAYRVMRIQRVKAQGLDIVYRLQLRV